MPTKDESLGAALSTHMARINDVQSPLQVLRDSTARTKSQCDALKSQRDSLLSEITELNTTVSHLKAERDSLRIEYASIAEQIKWWERQDRSVSGTLEYDTVGKATRRIWLLEEKIGELELEWKEERQRQGSEVEREQMIAVGLRERIGVLEQRWRKEEEEKIAASRKVTDLERLLREASERAEAERRTWDNTSRDLREALAVERNESEVLRGKAAVQPKLAQPAIDSPRRPLASLSSNLAPQPITPSKRDSTSVMSPTTGLARRYALLEERHQHLKAEYDTLRVSYKADIKHWKEYKAMETARIELKKQRKEERRASKAKSAASGLPAVALGESSDQSGPKVVRQVQGATTFTLPSSGEVVESMGSERVYLPIEEGKMTEMTASERCLKQNSASEDATRITDRCEADNSQWKASTVAIPQTTKPDHEKSDATPRPILAAHIGNPSRVTPWLGIQALDKNVHTFKDEYDIFQQPWAGSSPAATAKMLIRDRTGDSGRGSSRVAPLDRSVDVSDSASSMKRKDLDTDDMTPRQKAMALKRLARLPASEKRQIYAPYKGKGRYVAPEQLHHNLRDEYEIDPLQNEGEKHQFHDVKRRKTDRKQMHGGDCECCRGYYEAVGPIPRYNQPPAWKDTGELGIMDENEIRQHQDQVSRHRDTWQKPPTPPGYWRIGFPTTQDVVEQNKKADEMIAEKEAQVRKEAARIDGKWKKKM